MIWAGVLLAFVLPGSVMASAAGTASDNNISSYGSPKDMAKGELHAFYPSNAVFGEKMKKYIDSVDSISFAWSRFDGTDPGTLNTVKGKNNNQSFYYPADYIQPVEYAFSRNKSIQLNIYMDGSAAGRLLPYQEQRKLMIKAIMTHLQTELVPDKGIFYQGVVIDFEGLRDTDNQGKPILYEGEPISVHYIRFLDELKAQLKPLSLKLYTAVNPLLYYDGFDYAGILRLSDRVILMAHDYEPTGKLQKKEAEQYTGYNALNPIYSMAPIRQVRKALNEMAAAASDSSELKKVWLQLTFDSAQWRYDAKSKEEWKSLEGSTLSREERLTPLYQSIKDRVDNKDGKGEMISYGYNQELQTPYIQYYHNSDKTWNIILYEDSSSIGAKVDLAAYYGLGGISVWSLYNVPDYTDANGIKYHLDGWTTLLARMKTFGAANPDSLKTVSFTDSAVEKAVRDKLGKPTGKITAFDTASIYRLKLPKGVKSLNDLKHLTGLEYLDASQLDLKSIKGIESLKNLRVLYLQRNRLSDLTSLKKLTRLEVLSLNGNLLTSSSLTSLASLTKMKELYLRENRLKDITALSKLKQLEILELGENSISKADAVKDLVNLRVLSLDNNKITEVKALSGLTGLKELYLQRNDISSISSLSGLKNLKLMSLNGNKLTDIKALSKLTLLEKLYLKENKITSVAPLKGLTRLTELYLAGNPISDYSPLKTLTKRADFLCDFRIK